MANVTNTLTSTITSTNDTDGTVPINRGTGNPAFDSTTAEFTTYQKLAAGANNINLPVSPACQVYVKNLDPSLIITPTITPNGGIAAIMQKLNPGDQMFIWCNPAATTPGITALSLSASGANCLCEFFIGG